jgi:hypothetical protein
LVDEKNEKDREGKSGSLKVQKVKDENFCNFTQIVLL